MKQPNSLHCFVCGIANPVGLHLHFYENQPGEVEAHVTVPDQFQGYPGVVHGGIVSAMLDELAGRVYMGNAAIPRFMYTANLQVRYRKNVPIGKPLRVIGRGEKDRGRSATAYSAIYGPEGDLLAEAHVLLVNIPEGALKSSNLEELGWRVYPEQESPMGIEGGK